METIPPSSAATSVATKPIPQLFSLEQWSALARCARFDVQRLAGLPEVSLSVRSLERLFERNFRAAPSHYLMQWRAEMVRDYIATTGASNKEAAAEFGFCDEAHLCHVLKGAFNRSPQSFSPRRRARQLTLSLSLKYKQLSRLDKVADLGLGASVVKRNSGSRATVIPRQTIN